MRRALELAARGLYTSSPNPRVGCVLAQGERVVGEGWHERPGEPHAEINALRAAGASSRGATLYVTLEPCRHHGLTPPCTDAVVAAGVGGVIAAMRDPNPLAARGGEVLAQAGIAFQHGLLEAQARELNIGFVSRMERGRPWVRMKIAATLDGRTGLADGRSQWITGEAARRDGHHWRARACAILTGIGTVAADDPQLTVRLVQTPRQPQRVLIDSRLDVRPDAKLFAAGPVLVFCARDDAAKRRALEAMGAEVVQVANPQGKVELPAMLALLAERGVNELHVEAGYKLNGSLVRESCVDEFLLYQNASFLGNSPQGMLDVTEPESLEARLQLELRSVERLGDDLRMLARPR